MGNAWKAGVCVLAISVIWAGQADAAKKRPSLKCADQNEVAAIQTTVIDQQLVDAALTCGDVTRDHRALRGQAGERAPAIARVRLPGDQARPRQRVEHLGRARGAEVGRQRELAGTDGVGLA